MHRQRVRPKAMSLTEVDVKHMRGAHEGTQPRRLLGTGIAATLAANVAHGLGHGLARSWPAVALAGSYELCWGCS